MVDEVLPRSKHRFVDLRPVTANAEIVSNTIYCCKILGTTATENKYSFLGGRDCFQRFNLNTYMGLPEIVMNDFGHTQLAYLFGVLKQATVDNFPVGVRWISGLI